MTAHLKLFVSGAVPETWRMAAAVRVWCDRTFAGDYRLDVLDVLQWPDLAKTHCVLATPALDLDSSPARLVGDFSDIPLTMEALGIAAGRP